MMDTTNGYVDGIHRSTEALGKKNKPVSRPVFIAVPTPQYHRIVANEVIDKTVS